MDDYLDACGPDLVHPSTVTTDDLVAPLVMFADCFDDPDAVERRRVELIEWSAALDA